MGYSVLSSLSLLLLLCHCVPHHQHRDADVSIKSYVSKIHLFRISYKSSGIVISAPALPK